MTQGSQRRPRPVQPRGAARSALPVAPISYAARLPWRLIQPRRLRWLLATPGVEVPPLRQGPPDPPKLPQPATAAAANAARLPWRLIHPRRLRWLLATPGVAVP